MTNWVQLRIDDSALCVERRTSNSFRFSDLDKEFTITLSHDEVLTIHDLLKDPKKKEKALAKILKKSKSTAQPDDNFIASVASAIMAYMAQPQEK